MRACHPGHRSCDHHLHRRAGDHPVTDAQRILTARAGPDGEIALDFPAAPVIEQQAPDGLAKALGVPPDAPFGTGALRDLLAIFRTRPPSAQCATTWPP